MHDVIRIVLYGLIAAASPTMLLATLAILAGRRARLNGSVFMVGVLVGQSVAFLAVYLIGSTAGGHASPTVSAYLELAAGLGLLIVAWRSRRPHGSGRSLGSLGAPGSAGSDRSKRIKAGVERLTRVKPATLFGTAILLGIGVKRLAFTILAAETVALSGLGTGEDLVLAVLYVVIATLIVWFPVGAYLILGARSNEVVAKARSRVEAKKDRIIFISALVIGILLVLDAVLRLAV